MAPQFTDSMQTALETAYTNAQNRKQVEVTECHVLLSLLQDSEGYFCSLLRFLGLDSKIDQLLQECELVVEKAASFSNEASPPTFSQSLHQKILEADSLAKKWGDSYISPDHFLYVLWNSSKEPFSSWKKPFRRQRNWQLKQSASELERKSCKY